MSEVKASRFKDEKKFGVVVAIRSDESFDRYSVLKQGDYHDGRYGSQYDCGVYSPFMDLSTEDLWKMTTLLDLDANEIYSMYWDAGVGLADQRIGSPVNVHAKDSVKLFKVLNPDTYSRMVGRLDGVDFVSAYGGVFTNGFKYIKLDQPKPFYQGIVGSEILAEALNYIGVDYTIRDINEKVGSEKTTKVRNTKDEPVKFGMNVTLKELLPDFARKIAAEKAEQAGETELAERFRSEIPRPKTWYDYATQLVNDAEPMYQKSWIPKLTTSMKHWAHRGSAVNETDILGWEIISARKDKKFGSLYPEDYEKFVTWAPAGYADLSQKPILKLFRYEQDCSTNIARNYVEEIIENWDNGGREEFMANEFLTGLVFYGKGLPHLMHGVINYKDAPSAGEIRECVMRNVPWSESDNQYAGNVKHRGDVKDVKHKVRFFDGKFYETEDEVDLDSGWGATREMVVAVGDEGEYKTFVKRAEDGERAEWKEDEVKECLKKIANRTQHDAVRDGGGSYKRVTIMALRNDLKGKLYV